MAQGQPELRFRRDRPRWPTRHRRQRLHRQLHVTDAIIGLRGLWTPFENSAWFFPYYVDVGTGKLDSTWQFIAGAGYRFHWGDMAFSYRDVRYKEDADSKLLRKAELSGPTLSLTWHFQFPASGHAKPWLPPGDAASVGAMAPSACSPLPRGESPQATAAGRRKIHVGTLAVHGLGCSKPACNLPYHRRMPSQSAAVPTSSPTPVATPRGRLACVGLGMTLGSHLTPLARSHIEQADVVFAALSDGIVEMWLERMHPDVRSLQPYYGGGKSRMTTYRQWVDVMMAEVRAGKRVCGVFYGHPGVFAWSPHKVIDVARAEGFPAHMEPGISAEDCLYADLGIDPGRLGCQHFEASQLLFYERRIDPCGYVVLWQVGLVGDLSLKRFVTGPAYRKVLVERLAEDYPLDHEVIVYRAPTLPIHKPDIRRLRLEDLPDAEMTAEETVVLPPGAPLKQNTSARARLAALDEGVIAP